jgi:segregation and condensation protein B
MLDNKALIEGVLFASQHPVSAQTLAEVLGIEKADVETILAEIEAMYESVAHGFHLRKIGGGFQFRTKVELKEVMAKFYEKKAPRLSQATLEVLSIIAYKQPATRPEIEKIRGVDCTGVLKTLLERGLIEMKGRSDLPGHPVVYATAPRFLEWFQIPSLEDLPPLSEIEALNKASVSEGADHLMDLLNRDGGFKPEDIEDIDGTLQNISRMKSIEDLEKEAFPERQQPAETAVSSADTVTVSVPDASQPEVTA